MHDIVNEWEILDKIGLSKNGSFIYLVKCKCGKQYKKTISDLKKIKKCKSCYLELVDRETQNRHQKILGKTYNDWTVFEIGTKTKAGTLFKVRCKCGNVSELLQYKFMNGYSTKCLACSKIKHNKSYTRTYNIWAGVIQRCNNIKNKAYEYYGARGIKIYEKWLDFREFLKDMGDCPEGYELDRTDPDGNYEPSNCKWVTRLANAQNKRRSLKNKDRFIVVDKNKLCKNCFYENN